MRPPSRRVLAAVGGGLLATARVRPPSTEAQLVFPVAAFRRDDGSPVRDGDTIFIRGAADDWDDVTPVKPPGRSESEVEIHIGSADGIEAWLQRELAAMRPELLRLRDQEREVRNRTLEVAPLPDGTLSPADRDRLLSAEHIQDQIDRKIGDPQGRRFARRALGKGRVASRDSPREQAAAVEHDRARAARRR